MLLFSPLTPVLPVVEGRRFSGKGKHWCAVCGGRSRRTGGQLLESDGCINHGSSLDSFMERMADRQARTHTGTRAHFAARRVAYQIGPHRKGPPAKQETWSYPQEMDGLDGSADPAGETSEAGWKFTVLENSTWHYVCTHKKHKSFSRYHLSVIIITVVYHYDENMCSGLTASVLAFTKIIACWHSCDPNRRLGPGGEQEVCAQLWQRQWNVCMAPAQVQLPGKI